MTAVDYILDGLEAELALERELGVRTVEFDRALLAELGAKAPAGDARRVVEDKRRETRDARQETEDKRRETPRDAKLDFAFLHDRPLSPKGVEMMAKIITALGRTAETAPVIVAPPLPKAKVYVVLGGLALKKYFPALKGGPGQWVKTEGGEDVLVTYSPEYILRFGTVTPAVKKIKQDMWTSLKGVLQRV